MFSFLLAAQMILWSDRADFWDPDHLSNTTAEMTRLGEIHTELHIDELVGKRVLVLIHGYNNSTKDALTTYQQVSERFTQLKDPNGQELYDIVIGYLWPGNDSRYEYYEAKAHTVELALRFQSALQQLSSQAKSVDLFAHSMGNRLTLEALKLFPETSEKAPIQNFYSLAAAVDDESIERHQEFYSSTLQCENIFVFHSEKDDVLKYLYLSSEMDRALGFLGSENIEHAPENVRFIDCTAFVDNHSGYFTTSPLYSFILNQHALQKTALTTAKNFKLAASGMITPN